MKKLAVLGATGSVGSQTLDIVRRFKDKFDVEVVAASKVSPKLLKVIDEFKPRYVYLKNPEPIEGVKVLSGEEGIKLISSLDIDLFVNAVSGIDGILFTYHILEVGKKLATANKESVVCLGEILGDKFKEVIPLDSEHSAIFQLLQKEKDVDKIYLTSSGGPFLYTDRDEFSSITPEKALKHPKWSMGQKISVDSATLMNKGLEVIEAHYLFGFPYEKIDVVIHPQSIIHGLIQLKDSTILAHLSPTDMRYPILYALFYPERVESNLKKLDLLSIGKLEFLPPDTEKFPLLKVAIEAGKKGGAYPIVLTVADEIAVRKFLLGEISFLDIEDLIISSLEKFNFPEPKSINDVLSIIREVENYLGGKVC